MLLASTADSVGAAVAGPTSSCAAMRGLQGSSEGGPSSGRAGTSDLGAVCTFRPLSLCPRPAGLNPRDEEDDDTETIFRVTLDPELTTHFILQTRGKRHKPAKGDIQNREVVWGFVPQRPLSFVPNLATRLFKGRPGRLRTRFSGHFKKSFVKEISGKAWQPAIRPCESTHAW